MEKSDDMEMKCKVLNKKLEDRTRELESLKQSHSEELLKAETDRNHAM